MSEDTIRIIRQEYTTKFPWGTHLEEVKARFMTEQPHFVEFMEGVVGRYPPAIHIALFEVMISTIAVLEHQAEANRLSSKFNTEPEA